MATIKDIANAAGVSVATVSHVVNNTRFVSPELRKRVRGREQRNPRIKKNEKENPFFLHLYSAQRNVQKQRGKSGFSLHFGTGKCILELKKM